jgi:hypothetical protein
VNPVIEWLRSDEGEQWSRDRAARPGEDISHDTETWWRATGPLAADADPCGSPAFAIGTSTGERA